MADASRGAVMCISRTPTNCTWNMETKTFRMLEMSLHSQHIPLWEKLLVYFHRTSGSNPTAQSWHWVYTTSLEVAVKNEFCNVWKRNSVDFNLNHSHHYFRKTANQTVMFHIKKSIFQLELQQWWQDMCQSTLYSFIPKLIIAHGSTNASLLLLASVSQPQLHGSKPEIQTQPVIKLFRPDLPEPKFKTQTQPKITQARCSQLPACSIIFCIWKQ